MQWRKCGVGLHQFHAETSRPGQDRSQNTDAGQSDRASVLIQSNNRRGGYFFFAFTAFFVALAGAFAAGLRLGSLQVAAWAAARRAIGTRNGEQLT